MLLLAASVCAARTAPVAVCDGKVYVALSGGKIGVFAGQDLALKERIDTGKSEIQAIAAHDDDLAWLANDSLKPTLNIRRGNEIASIDWPGLSRKATLAWCGGFPLVVGERGVYTVKDGSPVPWKEVVPSDVARALDGSFVRVYGDLALAIKPYAIDRQSRNVCMANAIDLRGREPRLLGGFATTAPNVALGGYHLDRRSRITYLGSWDLRDANVSPLGDKLYFNEPDGPVRIDFRAANWAPERNVSMPASPTTPTLDRGRLTITDGNGRAYALMPWNLGAKPEAVLVVGDTACVLAGDRLAKIPSTSDSQRGFGGFVRVPLGADQETPPDAKSLKLRQEIESWQGTPYLWGGEDRNGVDCSGFVMNAFRTLGINLPHQSQEMAKTRKGVRVYDELRYGDVLVYPGHVAIYIGNGRTAETTDGGVGYGTIWSRTEVKIIRFLN